MAEKRYEKKYQDKFNRLPPDTKIILGSTFFLTKALVEHRVDFKWTFP